MYLCILWVTMVPRYYDSMVDMCYRRIKRIDCLQCSLSGVWSSFISKPEDSSGAICRNGVYIHITHSEKDSS